MPEYVNVTVAGKLGRGPVMLLSLTSSALSDCKPTKASGTGPVRLFPFKMMVASEVTFARAGEMVPTKPLLERMSDTTSPLPLHATPVHAGEETAPQGFPPTQVDATDCGYPAAARNSNKEATATEHATPGPPQKVPLSWRTVTPAGNPGSSPPKWFPLRTTSESGKLARASGN